VKSWDELGLGPRGRMRCVCCRQWMSHEPTEEEPVRRRPGPNASVCMGCKPVGWTEPYPRENETNCARRGCPSAVERLGDLVR